MKRRIKRKIMARRRRAFKNAISILVFVISNIVFAMSAVQFAMENPLGTIGAIVSGIYIVMWCWANDVGVIA